MGNFQMAMLVTGFLLGTAIMYIPILGEAEQNMWVSALIGWAIGMVYIYLISKIKQPKNYPLLLSAILSLYSLYMAAMVTRNIGEIMNITILTMTPYEVINATMVALAAYGVIMGIEVGQPFGCALYLYSLVFWCFININIRPRNEYI